MTQFVKHIVLIIQFELKRLFTSRKSLLYLITLSAVWFLVLFYPIRLSVNFLNQMGQSRSNAILGFFNISQINWSIIEQQVYWHFALITLPMLSIVLASDQTTSDRKRGTLRFLTLRTSRNSLFFGRFFAIMLIQILIILVTLISVLMLILYRDSSLLSVAANNSVSLLVNLIIVVLPFSALMAVLSTTVNSARQAIMWAILLLIFLSVFIPYLGLYFPAVDILQMLSPRFNSFEIAKVSGFMPIKLALIPLLQTVFFLAIGRWIMGRKSL